jgi:hypothetical protein
MNEITTLFIVCMAGSVLALLLGGRDGKNTGNDYYNRTHSGPADTSKRGLVNCSRQAKRMGKQK